MVRPNSRYRQIEYSYIADRQGGEYCNNCKYRPEKPGSLHIDHIVEGLPEPEYNAPKNKQLLCDICNAIKELERRKNVRDGVKNPGEGSQNVERASEPERDIPSECAIANADVSVVMYGEDRKDSRTSAEGKNEVNQPLCENIIKSEWNRETPTVGLVYPRCVPELVRRIREITGYGSDAAVKRYIKTMCSDGAEWRIDSKTKRIVPSNYQFYDPERGVTQEEILANHRRIIQHLQQDGEKARRVIAELKAQLTQSPTPALEDKADGTGPQLGGPTESSS